MDSMIADINNPVPAINAIREAIAVFQYYDIPIVHERLVRSANAFRAQLNIIQNVYNGLNFGVYNVDLVSAWDEWIRDQFRTIAGNAWDFVRDSLNTMADNHVGNRQVLENLGRLTADVGPIDYADIIKGLD